MTPDIIALLALVLLWISSFTIFFTTQWRLSIIMLALQYLGVFMLIAMDWPLQMAVVKLVAGWMAGAVLAMAMLSSQDFRDELAGVHLKGVSIPFYFFASILVWVVVISLTTSATDWLQDIQPEQAFGGLLLIGMGLLKLGFTDHPLSATLGILTAFSGFEIIYALIETSALLTGLLAGITLGLSMIGSYLLLAPHLQKT